MPPRLIEDEVQSYDLPFGAAFQEVSTSNDTHPKGTRQMRTMKYLRESCYHRIKCSVANFLAALMRNDT